MLYVGIDPGEEWCGVGVLSLDGKKIIADAAVYNVTDHSYLALAAKIAGLPRWSNAQPTFIIEDYHVRPVGHQAFTRGMTLRFIGALEYACAMISAVEFADYRATFINPGDPAQALALFKDLLLPWDQKLRGDKRWNHALSAWRVIGMHLLKHRIDDLKRLQCVGNPTRRQAGGDETTPGDLDLHADTITWWPASKANPARKTLR